MIKFKLDLFIIILKHYVFGIKIKWFDQHLKIIGYDILLQILIAKWVEVICVALYI